MPITVSPLERSALLAWNPIKPAEPVTKIFINTNSKICHKTDLNALSYKNITKT
jgi:hypothetical protein